ncbi:MAG: PIN domain-containing protein [bacterium]
MRKYRVVVDTNVFVSSFWGGNPEKLVRLLPGRRHRLRRRVRIRDERIGPGSRRAVRQIELGGAGAVSPQKVFSTIKDDPHDNKFLDCAFAGEAQFIVSGDRHLLRLRKFKDVRIVTVKEFLDLP